MKRKEKLSDRETLISGLESSLEYLNEQIKDLRRQKIGLENKLHRLKKGEVFE
jgi:chaperonin cofactor prefoldin